MGIADEIQNESSETMRAEVLKVRRERDSAISEMVRVSTQLEQVQRALHVVEQAESAQLQPVKWLMPTAKPRPSAATLVLMLSDLHLDEIVEPDEVDGLNAYNRTIAVQRMKRWSNNVVKLARHHLSGMKYDGVVLMLGGDTFSGDIHDELKETNEDSMLGSLLYWAEQIASAIDLLADEFKKVHVAAVAGNHGRTTRKPRMKLRARTNFDWLLAKMLERHFAGDRRVTFQIPESSDCLISIYDTNHLLTHGDQTQGGGSIGGIYPPIMRMRARKAQRYLATGASFQTLWLGHWHQYLPSPSMVVNGSLKGYDEYAYISNFSFEPPQQALAIVVPEKGITIQAPVFCLDRKAEGW
ncbi:hypothetical protein UFOVP1387_38 [uncultured Caudovirales phage]|jgi:hypothetical protein|uniref:Calcineurin-like phosphoesterase domain-containing protein n=1 Tax=uncultured Caudovirales phage TaxID=2100421 RepID=A0A6J5S6A7_9CAUD|nr:hypothetical protein UFOVP1387_38 [uncultured Caudovirales phage]